MSYARQGESPNEYHGAISRGKGWTILWEGSRVQGMTPIEAVVAAIQNLEDRQNSGMASNENAKLLAALIKAKEEYYHEAPTIGAELNDLIPKGDE